MFIKSLFYLAAVCMQWKINTSNQGKLAEFGRFFEARGSTLTSTQLDLPEIVADPLQVIVYKATLAAKELGEKVLIEDTSLDIEGADVGINIRWLLDHLDQYEGRKATWTVFLAYCEGGQVYVYKGTVSGKIVQKSGQNGFGFDPYFLPDGATQTLAEHKPDAVNARAKAVDALFNNDLFSLQPCPDQEWSGDWQH